MKKLIVIFIGLLFLGACSTDELSGITYEFEKDQQQVQEEGGEFLANSYQITIDESFEMVPRYGKDTASENMYFWHKPSASEYPFELGTTRSDFEQYVPTLEINPINKYMYSLLYADDPSYFAHDLTDEEVQEIIEDIKRTVEEESEAQIEEMKEEMIEMEESGTVVYTNKELDIEPFTYMLQSATEQGIIRYQFIGEVENEYLRATLSIPNEEKEELFESMLAFLQTITYNEDEFIDHPVLDKPLKLSYKPAENLQGSYPSIGYSFEVPDGVMYGSSFPGLYPYRYTFRTLYEESIEKEHFTLRSSELFIRVEKKEHVGYGEEEIRNRNLQDFVAFQYDYARSITYLHEDENVNTGVFTTAVKVDFDGYEEYWFVKEVDGHLYEVTFDIAIEALEYGDLLDSYLNVIRTFELKGVE
ncbi:hypothetical protein ACERJO_16400 [Halalkalibacter sp. AB-rgal2]|uniref:hypothetical protein n=1 Tax=Halalkalibacter sp. AB-rgal2 TaxID=3242695 RepID=UPI00359D1254